MATDVTLLHVTSLSCPSQNPVVNFIRRASATSVEILQHTLPFNLFGTGSVKNVSVDSEDDIYSEEDPYIQSSEPSIYDFAVHDLNDNLIPLSKYRGKVVLIVNVASQCAFTYANYNQLQSLHKRFYKEGLRILAFPCNQFGGQEPGTSRNIKDFIKKKEAEFDVFAKINVNGKDAHPLFLFLQEKLKGSLTNDIKWNFTKFLINRKGIPVDRYAPTTEPLELAGDIIHQLKKTI